MVRYDAVVTAVRAQSGRRAEAARNDERILAAARAVFVADPTAPIAAVAARAGVGIGALYRRYPSKEELLRRLCGDGMAVYIAEAETALADAGDPRDAFVLFIRRVLDADTHSLTLRLAGTFTPTELLWREGARCFDLTQRLIDRTRAAGALRADVEVGDLSLLFEQLAAIRLGDDARTSALRHRHLSLALEALRAPGLAPLPGSAMTQAEIGARWRR